LKLLACHASFTSRTSRKKTRCRISDLMNY
jgi:hypothetical protein